MLVALLDVVLLVNAAGELIGSRTSLVVISELN